MRLADRIKGLFGITWGGGSTVGKGSPYTAQEWALGLPDTVAATVENPYATHPTVAVAISGIANDAAAVDWELYEEGSEDDPLEEHPLLDLWERPNPFMSGTDLWVATYVNFKVFGECWWYYPGLRVNGSGATRATRKTSGELVLLDPRAILVKRDDSGSITYWIRTVSGQEQPLEADFLTQFKRYNPYSPMRGLSELDALTAELSVDVNAARWNLGFFGDQNGVPTALLKPPETGVTIPPQDRESYLQQWNTRYSRKRGVGMLPPGWDWIEAGSSPKDMEFGELRDHSREQILAVEGMPPFLAGVLDKANYANAREQKSVYWHGTITRMLEYFQGVLNFDFLPKVGVTGIEVYPCYEKIRALTDNLVEKSDVAGKLFQLGFTKRQINERLELGMEVDDLEDADVGYLPISMVPVSMVEEAHTPVAPVAPPGDEPAPTDTAKGLRFRQKEGRRANVWRAIIAQTRDVERRFGSMVRSHFQSIEAEVQATLAGLKGWNLVHGVEKADDSNLFDVPQSKRHLQRVAEPIYTLSIRRGGNAVLAEINVPQEFNVADPRVTTKLAELTSKISRIDDTVEQALRKEMVEGILAGENIDMLAKRVSVTMDTAKSRAGAIARTETGNAFNAGRVTGMEQAGVQSHEWLTARDGDVRDSHVQQDGSVVRIGDTFANGLRWPCDNIATDPAEVVNCRCTVVPVIGGSAGE